MNRKQGIGDSKTHMTVTDYLRKAFQNILIKIASAFLKVGFSANAVTLLGLAGSIIGAVFIAIDKLVVGGTVFVLMCPFDAIDGTMARLSDCQDNVGGLLDSVVDRYVEMVMLLGILTQFISKMDTVGVVMTFLALSGSFLTSYIRARTEGLGENLKEGVMTRIERLFILILSLLFKLPLIGVIIVAALGNFTAIQRFFIAKKKLTKE